MSKNFYAVFWEDPRTGKLQGAWYTELQRAVNGYFNESFQEEHKVTSLRMKTVLDSETSSNFDKHVYDITNAEKPDFFGWITLESKHELPAEEILDRELALVCAEYGSCHTEVFRSLSKTYAVVRIRHQYWHFRVDGQQVKKTVLNP